MLEKNKNHGSVIVHTWLILLGVLLLSPLVSPTMAEPPSNQNYNCLGYGYSESERHYFMINNYSLVFGNNITFEHNCDNLSIIVDDVISANSNNKRFDVRLNTGFYNITLTDNENFTRNYSYVQILPDRLTWEYEYQEWKGSNDRTLDEFISLTSSEARENWASILSIAIVFSLTTMVYWHLINAYIDRNYCEEVQ